MTLFLVYVDFLDFVWTFEEFQFQLVTIFIESVSDRHWSTDGFEHIQRAHLVDAPTSATT